MCLGLLCCEVLFDCIGWFVSVGGWMFDFIINEFIWIDEICCLYELVLGYWLILEEVLGFYLFEVWVCLCEVIDCVCSEGGSWDLELLLIIVGGCCIWVCVMGSVDFGEDG